MHLALKVKEQRLVIIFGIVIIFEVAQCFSKGVQKSVTTLLDTKWPYSSTVLEASEYFSDESSDCYWKFVEESALQLSQNLNYTEEDIYRRIILHYAENYFTKVGVQLLEFSLALHLYSPKIEMFRQVALELKVDCDIGIYHNEEIHCSLTDFKSKFKQGSKLPFTMDNDHEYPGVGNAETVVILFGDVQHSEFLTFHNYLKSLSLEGKASYFYRPYIKSPKRGKVRLSGYGVELAIKSTEYRAQDDTKVKSDDKIDISNEFLDDEIEGFFFNKLKSLYPEKEHDLERLRNHLLDSTNELAKLKVWELQELSLQASERIKTASPEHVLKELITYSQNFPILAPSLVKTVVRPDTKKEVLHNQRLLMHELNIQPGESGLFIDGMQFDVDSIDIFSLFDVVRDEQKIIESLHSLGLKSSQIADLMSITIQDQSQNFAINFVDSAVIFVNDIENDKQYRVWPSSLMDILRPMFPGMLRPVRRNMFHLVIILDPTDAKSYHLVKLAESFYVNRFPLRIGFVFAVDHSKTAEGFSDAGIAMVESFNYITEEKNAAEALSFITDIYAAVGSANVTVTDVTKQLTKKFPGVDLDSVFGQDSEYDYGRQLAHEFISRKGISNLPKVLMNGVALSDKSLSMDAFEESVLVEISHCTNSIAKALHKRELQDSDDVVEYLMKQPNVLPRFNNLILKEKYEYLDFTSGKSGSEDHSNVLREMLLTMPYLSAKSQKVKAHTIWILANISTSKGRDLILSALEHLVSSSTAKVGLIFNIGNAGIPNILPLLYYSQHVAEGDRLIKLFKKLFQTSNFQELLMNPDKIFDHLEADEADKLKKIDKSGLPRILDLHKDVCQKLSILPDQWAIVANGMILGPFKTDVPTFLPDDFNLIEKLLSAQITDSINVKLQDEQDRSYLIASLSSLFLSKPPTKPRIVLPEFKENFGVVKLPSKSIGTPSLDVVAIVDPLSRAAQKLAPLLLNLHEVADCQIKLVLNALEKHSEMPLKNFYRFILEPKLKFQSDGSLSGGPSALFTNLPTSTILTMNLHVPDNWLVEVVRSPYDLDNIHLADVESDVHSEYELEYLLLEGHCFEQSTGNPPRGLQFVLGTSTDPNKFDTIVMANLGYFQLKSNPGSWVLHLREGRSFDIYDIANVEGVNTFKRDAEINVVMDSFKSHIIKVKVNKKPDKQHVELLQDEDEGGLWNSITSSFTGSGKGNQEDTDTINIFSLASGHLYERFLRIMMLSVLKNTKHPVKFWFLKNFLSPSFKDFLPKMAQEYKFDFELVQYKWPRWLHQQIEKQRIIWGYKVLFLDVLFPLDVKKIIFVDADQVVRADMKELMDLDLGGAPYGYTPFCDDKKEMDGYRFWKAGYWKSHLQHRKYHISALYVVDLKKFRRIAAGDRLRGQYQGLSQDPNSLSNLDQDLPNNMIHQVAIKSLPQEWLWCETWCDDASKPYAKTIDLCNNPMTKEAKLDAAMRIIDEWTSYDDEIKSLQSNHHTSGPAVDKSEL